MGHKIATLTSEQNRLAGITTNSDKFSSIISLLKDLHRLPIKQHCMSKVPQHCFIQSFSITDFLCRCNFAQIIDSPSHIHGHILDVLGIRDTFSKAVCPKVIVGLSEYLAITFYVEIPFKAPSQFRQVNKRKIHRININDFREDILNSDLIKHPHKTESLLSHQYFNTLRNILDRHAPVNRKKYHCTMTKAS